ncbi:hypothetical protein D3C78_973220 [compost metagenome]
MNFTTGGQPGPSRFCGLGWQWACAFAGDQTDLNTGRRCQSGDHVTVAAVVAMATQHQPVMSGRVLVACQDVSSLTGTLHQLVE